MTHPEASSYHFISRVWPKQAVAGKSFNVQADGSAALGVEGSLFLPGASIQFDDVTLDTTFSSSNGLTGIVPVELIEKPHIATVPVKNPDGKTSNAVNLTIKPGPWSLVGR